MDKHSPKDDSNRGRLGSIDQRQLLNSPPAQGTWKNSGKNSRVSDSYLLDQRELNELISIDVHAIAMQRAALPKGMDSPKPKRRKNSDDDYYVEETLLFTY